VTRDLHPTVCELSFDRSVARKCHSAYTSPLPIDLLSKAPGNSGSGGEKSAPVSEGVFASVEVLVNLEVV